MDATSALADDLPAMAAGLSTVASSARAAVRPVASKGLLYGAKLPIR